MNRSLASILLCCFVLAGCLDDGGTVDPAVTPPELPLSPEEQMVIANCEAVVQAAEDFAAQNGGEYPHDVGSDETPAGDTLIDLLPAGILMTNPFTQANTEPSDGSAATEGQTGYVRVADSGGSTVGYYVTGVGEHISEYVFERLKP